MRSDFENNLLILLDPTWHDESTGSDESSVPFTAITKLSEADVREFREQNGWRGPVSDKLVPGVYLVQQHSDGHVSAEVADNDEDAGKLRIKFDKLAVEYDKWLDYDQGIDLL